MIPRVLVIAGSDSGGGAGIQADIKTITMLGGYVATAITAVTAQNTLGVTRVDVLPPDAVVAQIDAVLADIGAGAIKIGMLGSAAIAHAVADRLIDDRPCDHVILDPVMVATSGATLADDRTVAALERLIGVATLVTPNLPELAALSGVAESELANRDRQVAAAVPIVRRFGAAVLVKGGHAPGTMLVDRLVGRDGIVAEWRSDRIETRHTHGTGCTLASAIATGLAVGMALPDAIERARGYVRAALLAAPGLGGGYGPIGHALGQSYSSAGFYPQGAGPRIRSGVTREEG
ncbi:bifunctional hydroxymethylpyrimidine kinase/phosphomethylpyrimidine kinase [Sphingomonas sp.]|uniref:bifunctional hydroxymethylpyrimidine kinase/phosphomethylpyrimidine kinase n=1 Tax=Sphingomonas sp. TaxID=28214 RepID=UPI003B00AE4D